MKITFLGTGAAEGIPAFRCLCKICENSRKKKGKEVRQNSSIHIAGKNGSNILIDMPPHIKMALDTYGIRDTDITTILFSHYHIDHMGGCSNLLDVLQKNGHVGDNFVTAYMPEDCKKTLFDGMFSDQIDLHTMDYKRYYSLESIQNLEKVACPCGSLNFQALETNHLMSHPGIPYKRESFGYLISEENKCIAHLVDSSSILPDATLEALTKDGLELDCMIHECTYDVYPGDKKGHSTLESIIQTREKFKPKKMIMTHISHRNLCHDELTDYMRSYDIDVAWDGMEIDI